MKTMKHKVLIFWIAALCLGVGGLNCQTVGTKFTYQRTLELGKTKREEVLATYGEPKSKGTKSRNGLDTDYYHYYVKNIWTDEYKELVVEFAGDIVNSFYYQANWQNEATDFEIDTHKKIVVGKSTKDSVIELLGNPHGRLILPSNLISLEYEKSARAKGARTCFRYAYVGMQGSGYSAMYIEKVLLIYFGDSGQVVDVFVSNVGRKGS